MVLPSQRLRKAPKKPLYSCIACKKAAQRATFVQKEIMKILAVLLSLLIAVAGFSGSGRAHAEGPMTWTVEPWDFGLNTTVTQLQFGGTQCPCTKIPYKATVLPWDTDQGADNINTLVTNGTIKSGDTIMGFSLGSQVISLYLAEHTPPPGIKFLLAGDTFWRNQQFLNGGVDKLVGTGGIPWNIANQVTLVANEFDGWSDQPDLTKASGYSMAVTNANDGKNYEHYYANAQLNNPNNVVTHRGNITAILIPTQKLPINNAMRLSGNASGADAADAKDRPEIEAAYSGPRPSAEQLAGAAGEQVPIPNPPWAQTPEPVANLK
jgi:PE-PPE domain